jgi:hypothetical protein
MTDRVNPIPLPLAIPNTNVAVAFRLAGSSVTAMLPEAANSPSESQHCKEDPRSRYINAKQSDFDFPGELRSWGRFKADATGWLRSNQRQTPGQARPAGYPPRALLWILIFPLLG